MSDPLTMTTDIVDAGPAPAESAQGAPDDLNSVLAEFDTAVGSSGQHGDTPPVTPEPPLLDRQAARSITDGELNQMAFEQIRQKVIFDEFVGQHIEHQQRVQEQSDFQEVLQKGAECLEDIPLTNPQEEVRRWFLAEAQINPHLHQAWIHRRDSDEHHDQALREIRRAFKRMQQSYSKRYDINATEDRNAVTAAMRGAGSAPPIETGASYGKRLNTMTDSEFRQEKEKLGL